MASPLQWKQWRALERPRGRCHSETHTFSTLWVEPLRHPCHSPETDPWETEGTNQKQKEIRDKTRRSDATDYFSLNLCYKVVVIVAACRGIMIESQQSQFPKLWFRTFWKCDEGLNDVPAVFFQTLGLISAVEEFALEELHCDNSEDKHEEDVDDEDVENILQRVYDTVKHRL